MKNRRMVVGLIVFVLGGLIAEPTAEFYTPSQDRDGLEVETIVNAELPNVLIIGDSISISYTEPVIELLNGVANVQRANANCGDTNRGLQNLDRWLGHTKWDVIHFNWGLHDLCYRHPDAKVYGNRDKVNGTVAVPLDKYAENLDALVLQLKATNAALIWASTTVVPEGEAGRIVGDELRYNHAAIEIMQRHNVAVNDLHALSATFPPDFFLKSGDVHYQKSGKHRLAEQVAASISVILSDDSN
jgi:hypothetical protein